MGVRRGGYRRAEPRSCASMGAAFKGGGLRRLVVYMHIGGLTGARDGSLSFYLHSILRLARVQCSTRSWACLRQCGLGGALRLVLAGLLIGVFDIVNAVGKV